MTDGRRSYDNTRRREQAADTRRRIVEAGSELLHASHIRDWGGITVRAVAERAGVHERTVYRHFANERVLREAVMAAVEEEAGVELEGMRLEDVSKVASRILEYIASFPPEPRPLLDPTLTAANRRQHATLLDAVGTAAPAWSADDRTMAAAVLDVLWSVSTYERLAHDWELDPDRVVRTVVWVIGMVEAAVRDGRGPGDPR